MIYDNKNKPLILNGPNELLRKSGNHWDIGSIVFLNFENYGTNILLSKKQIIQNKKETIIPEKKEEKIIDPTPVQKQEIKQEVVKKEIKKIEKSDFDNPNYSGYPVQYFFDVKKNISIRQFFQIENLSLKEYNIYCEINEWKQKVGIVYPSYDHIILGEWNNTYYEIINITKNNKYYKFNIKEKQNDNS